ncbi:peptidoglycan DD-metalloendopeptidase family protein [Mangrovimonas spongiae]|uniref:Peptidase M23 n=1 Tax=Mangrovimonas spongiae TaxID=2494697 RepID=A0A3R9M9M1_9FLAO|nr:peptidoglycan DD-metalloendopeptidase family protein [Mangrovimonas spongiae]RSK40534.1 peptidase M23 [Mangrovimonas spongiae]
MNPSTFNTFLKQLSWKTHSVLSPNIKPSAYVPINLSQTNPQLNTFNIASSSDWEKFIQSYLKSHQAKVAYGGYLEQRNIYKRSGYFNPSSNNMERNIHLGVDFWLDAGEAIYAPLDATIHSFNNNTNYGDYGPTIILKHTIENQVFFTLYGHLSLESIKGIKQGDIIQQGEAFASLGTAEVNGDYAPHLHFQIIRDIADYKGDYPGVCSKKNLDKFKSNCPDPNVLLNL